MNTTKFEIRTLIHHEFSLGRKPRQAHQNIIQTKGPGVVSHVTVKRWYGKFRDGQMNIEDEPKSGRPSKINEDAVLAAIEADPTLSARMLAADFHCSFMQITRILHKLGKEQRKGRWIPHELTQQQKNQRLVAAQQLLQRHQEAPFLDRIVTCDEKWVSYKNPVNKKQWLSPGQRVVSTPKPDWRQRRVLLCVWWWRGGVIHWETVPNGQTITSQYYCSQLDRVQRKLRSPGYASHFRRGVVFQQDNARPHVANATLQKIEELGWETIVHPPYSPDCAPSDYHLFASLAHSLSGKSFVNLNMVQNHLQLYFASKNTHFYSHGIDILPNKWQLIIDNNGNYFES
jgi:[histone H3]-lysine36 N-dimethyltransferase SETMAR